MDDEKNSSCIHYDVRVTVGPQVRRRSITILGSVRRVGAKTAYQKPDSDHRGLGQTQKKI